MSISCVETAISGLYIAETTPFKDVRGAFSRLFCSQGLELAIGNRCIVQINHSMSRNIGTVRGLHYQKSPSAELKIVRCIKGRIFDVAVDLRKNSKTFLKWQACELSPESARAFIIPEGCAHGFQVLEANTELLYLHTEFYTPGSEGAVRYDETKIDIDWPLLPTDISTRDMSHPALSDDFTGIVL